MDCIFDLNFDILNLINDKVIKKRKLMKYLDEKEKKTKYQSYFVFTHINMLKEIYNESIIHVLNKDEILNKNNDLLDDGWCRDCINDKSYHHNYNTFLINIMD